MSGLGGLPTPPKAGWRNIVERRHQILRKALSIFMVEHQLNSLEGLHSALNWVVQSINRHTFVNGFTPTQLALGREPHLPGLLSDERTGPLQLQMTEQERLYQKLKLKMEAQQARARAEVDVKLRRALLRKFTGRDEDRYPGERCYYWRESTDRFHTIRWKGPAVVVAVQRNADTGAVGVYWLAHGTVLLRAGRQHVRRLAHGEGRVAGQQRAEQALEQLRQRRVVRMVDLRRVNRRTIDELDPELDDILDAAPDIPDEAPNLERNMSSPAAVMPDADDDYEPSPIAENDPMLEERPATTSHEGEPMSEPSQEAPVDDGAAEVPVPIDDDLASPSLSPAHPAHPAHPEPGQEIVHVPVPDSPTRAAVSSLGNAEEAPRPGEPLSEGTSPF